MTNLSRKFSIIVSTFIITALLFGVVFTGGVLATTDETEEQHRTYTLQDGDTRYYGMNLTYSDASITSGETWEISHPNGDNITATTDSGSVTFDTNQISNYSSAEGTQAEVLDASGNTVLTFTLEEQTFNSEFVSDTVANSGSTTVDLNLFTGRTDPQYDVIVSENSGTLTNSEIAGLSPAFTVQTLDAGAGSEVVLAEDYSSDVTETLDFSGIPADVYDFTFEVRDSPSSSDPAPVVSDTATIDVRDQEPGTLTGTVVTGDSDYTGPINIEIENTETGDIQTDSTTGTNEFPYTFDGLEPGTYDVFATAEDHEDFTGQVTINEGGTVEENIELNRETVTFNGSISTEGTDYFEVGAGITNQEGNIVDTDFGQATAEAYTYELTGFVGETYTLTADAEYHIEETMEVSVSSDGGSETNGFGLALKRGTIEGVVNTEDTGYSGDLVVDYEHLPSGDAGQLNGTGDTFNYSESALKAGEYELTYSAPDGPYESVTQNVTINNDGEVVTAPEVTLSQTQVGSVSGEIQTENTAYDGQISVDLTNINTGENYTETGTGSSLSYSFTNIPTGDYEITANAENHDQDGTTIQLSDGQSFTFDTTLNQQAVTKIEGTVDVENEAYTGDITVRLLDQSTGSERDSVTGSGSSSYSYQFRDIPAGSYTVEASANNHSTETSDVSVNSGETVLQNFSLTSTQVAQGTYSGTYSTENTDYTGPITVNIQDTDTTFETTLDGTGPEFTFNETLDEGEYDVTVSADLHEDYTTTISVPADGGISDSAELVQDPIGYLSLEVDTEDTSYEGDITAEITNQDNGETTTRTFSATNTDPVLVALEAGNYEVVADARGHEEVTRSFTIAEGSTTTETFTLPELTQGAQGTVTTEDGDYTGPITLEFTNQDTGNVVTSEGTGPQYEYDVGLDAGTYDLAVSANDHSTATETITVQNNSITNNSYTLSQIRVDLEIAVDVNTVDGNSYGPVTVGIDGPSSDSVTIEDGSTQTVTLAGTGTYEVFADNTNLTEDRQTVNAGSDDTFTVNLAPEEQDSGTLEVTASTEETVDQISVAVEDDSGTEVATDTISGSSGVSTFQLESGEYTVITSAPQHESQETTLPVEVGRTATVEVALNLESVDFFDGSVVWVGQLVEFSDVASEGDEVRFVNQESGTVYEVVLENGTTLESTVLQEQVGTGDLDVSVNGSSVGVLSLQEQTLNTSYASELELPNRTAATLAVETNRSGQQTIVFDSIETPSGDTLDGAVLAEGNAGIVEGGDNNAEYAFDGDSITLQNQFDSLDLQTGEYTVNTFIKDTGVESSATLTVNAEETLENLVADETITDNGLFWVGQTLKYEGDAINRGETYRIVTEEDGSLVREIQPRQSDGVLIFNTADQSEGDYKIRTTDGTVLVSYLLRTQTFSTELSDEEVLNSGVQTKADVDFTSNRGTYDVIIEDDSGIDNQDLASRVSGASVVERDFDEDGEVEEEVVVRSVGLSETIEFQDYPEGSANFTFTVLDTGVSSEASIEVLELEDAQPSFTQQFYESYEGDTAEIEVAMPQGVETAEVTIGGEERFGYVATITLTDSIPTERSTAVIEMNTLTAGQNRTDVTFDVETLDREDEEGVVRGEVERETQIPEGRILDPTGYLLTLQSDGVDQDLSGLKHFEIEIDGSTTYISPQTTSLETINNRLSERSGNESDEDEEDEEDDESDVSNLPPVDENAAFYESKLVTESKTVATPDTMYLYYDVNGFEEILSENSVTASDFDMESAFSKENGFELQIERTNPPINFNGKTLGPSDIEYHYDDENKFVFFEFSPSLIAEEKAKPGDKFEATLTINSNNPVVEETEGEGNEISSTAEFEVVEPTYTFNDPVEVEPSADQQILAKTTIAPQTDVQVVARSDDVTYPFLYKQEATVDENGVISTTFDFTGAPEGHEFEVLVEGLSEPKEAVVVEDRTTLDVTPADEETDDGEEGEGDGEDDGEGEDEETEGTTVPVTFDLTDQSGASLDGTISIDGEPQEVTNGTLTTELTTGTSYEFRANAPDYAAQTVVREVTEEQDIISFQLEEIAEQNRVDVRVIDSEEEDIVGAEVSTESGKTATVGENGTATFQLENGEYILTASAEGYEDNSINITVDGEDRSEVIELTETSSDGSSGDGDGDGEGESDGSGDGEDEDVRAPGQPGFTTLTVTIALIALAMYIRRE